MRSSDACSHRGSRTPSLSPVGAPCCIGVTFAIAARRRAYYVKRWDQCKDGGSVNTQRRCGGRMQSLSECRVNCYDRNGVLT